MNFEQLKNRITEIAQTEDFKLLQGSTGKFALKINGVWLCHQESPETILWAIVNPEEHRSREDSEIDKMLADLSAECGEGGS